MTFNDGFKDLEEKYDEFNEVYGCDADDGFIRCCECDWEGCPKRGKSRG